MATTANDNNTTQILISLEGNIGAGKTTLLTAVREQLESNNLIHHFSIQTEPLREWTNVCGTDLLTAYYRNPYRWAFTFNLHVLNTLIERKHSARTNGKPFALFERSCGATKHVFVSYAHSRGYLTDFELSIFNNIWRYSANDQEAANPPSSLPSTVTIYLRTPPELCYQRIKQREQRQEEEGSDFSVAWLTQLHLLHDQWLLPNTPPILILNGTLPVKELVTQTITFLKSLMK